MPVWLTKYTVYQNSPETFGVFLVSSGFMVYICAALKSQQHIYLLQKCGELFKKYGVKSYTMDDIARELGMSKKTIYQFVENKAELVRLTLQNYLDQERAQIESILKAPGNSVDEMIQMMYYFFNQVQELNPSALNDLQKYYPETWDIYSRYRFEFMLGMITDNLQKGINEGLYRADLNADIIARVYIANTAVLIDQDLFPGKNYVFINTYKEYLNYHLRGILSPRGLQYLEEHNLFKR